MKEIAISPYNGDAQKKNGKEKGRKENSKIEKTEFYPFRRKRYKFRKSKTFKNPEKRYEKHKGRRYWKKNDSTNKKVPN